MARKDIFQVSGRVIESLPNTTFRVELPNGHQLTGFFGEKMPRGEIRVLPGDEILLEVTSYDLTKGRITPP